MKKIVIICLSAVLIIASVVSSVFAFGANRESRHFKAGNEYFDAGEYAKAISEYIQCINLNDENADAYYKLAQAHYANGSNDLAAKIAEIGYEKTQNFQLYYYIEFLQEEADAKRIEELKKIGLPYYLEEAVCAYYDLLSHDEITQEMLESVTSVQIMLYGYKSTAPYGEDNNWSDIAYNESDYTYYVDASINNSPFGTHGPYIRKNRYEKMFLEKIDSEIAKQKVYNLILLKDPSDISLTEKAKKWMYERFPYIKESGASYIYDPSMSMREKKQVNRIIDTYMYTEPEKFAVNKTVDLATLELLPNLQSIVYWINLNEVENGFADINEYKEYMGLTFINSPVEIVEIIDEYQW